MLCKCVPWQCNKNRQTNIWNEQISLFKEQNVIFWGMMVQRSVCCSDLHFVLMLTAHRWSLSGQQLLLVLLITCYYDQLPSNYSTNQHTSISIHHHLLYDWSESRVSASLREKKGVHSGGRFRKFGQVRRKAFKVLWPFFSDTCGTIKLGHSFYFLSMQRESPRPVHYSPFFTLSSFSCGKKSHKVSGQSTLHKRMCVHEHGYTVHLSKKQKNSLLWSCSPAWWHPQQTYGCRQIVSPRPCGPRYAPSGKPSHPGGSSPDHRP